MNSSVSSDMKQTDHVICFKTDADLFKMAAQHLMNLEHSRLLLTMQLEGHQAQSKGH